MPPRTQQGRAPANPNKKKRVVSPDDRAASRMTPGERREISRASRAVPDKYRPKAEPFKGKRRPMSAEERDAVLALALERSGVFDTAKQAPRIYNDRSPQGKVLSAFVGPAGMASDAEKAFLLATTLPFLRPIRLAKGATAGAGALRLGGGRAGARAAFEAAYKTPTLATGARKLAGKVGGRVSPRAATEAARKLDPDSPEIKVREALGPARTKRAEQQRGYREERGKRIAAAEEASEAAGGGIEGYKAAGGQLRGELPKVQFRNLRELSETDLDQLFRAVQDHPELRPFEKRRAMRGLMDAFEKGTTPQKSQIKLLQTVFGQDGVDAIKEASRLSKVGKFVLDGVNMPRALVSSGDFSAPFRQNLAAGARHPVLFAKNFPRMFKDFAKEENYQAANAALRDRPNYDLYDKSGLDLLDLGDELMQRDELFMSQMAERIPLAGRLVRMSGRAFNSFGNHMRADMFDEQLRLLRKAGRNVEDRTLQRGIANLANNATGRGTLGPLESWAPALTGIFWSPRLAASRINFFNPFWYAGLPKGVRKEAIRTMVHLGAAASSVLGVAYLFGARVGTDPRNADFAKVRLGNTRADVLGGFQQYIRLGSQLGTGEIISSTSGEKMRLEGGFGGLSRRDIVQRFGESKLNPAVSFFNDMLKGEDFERHPFRAEKAALQRVIPLVAQDAYDLHQNTDSVPLALLGFAVASFGIGTQTYGAKKASAVKHEKKLAEWTKESTEAWKPIGPLPAVAVRAMRTKTRYEQQADELAASLNAKKLTPKQRLAVLVNVAAEDNPQMGFLKDIETNNDSAEALLRELQRDLYGKILEDFNAELRALKKAR
jgi:hypothetical protein